MSAEHWQSDSTAIQKQTDIASSGSGHDLQSHAVEQQKDGRQEQALSNTADTQNQIFKEPAAEAQETDAGDLAQSYTQPAVTLQTETVENIITPSSLESQPSDEPPEEEDFLEFRLHHENGSGIVQTRSSLEDGPAELILHRSSTDTAGSDKNKGFSSLAGVSSPSRGTHRNVRGIANSGRVSISSNRSIGSSHLHNVATPEALDADETLQPESAVAVAEQPGNVILESAVESHDVSEASHLAQNVASKQAETGDASADEEVWQDMKTLASYDVYDDKGNIIVHNNNKEVLDDEKPGNSKMGAANGYTRVTRDEDAKSINSLDENTSYLFDDDELARNPLTQLQATKSFLTDNQKIGYVGLCKAAVSQMEKEVCCLRGSKRVATALSDAVGSVAMWGQKVMMKLYKHMDLSPEEQIMIEQLSVHGVLPSDLAPSLHATSTVKNPYKGADHTAARRVSISSMNSDQGTTHSDSGNAESEKQESLSGDTLDIDIRWTVLCDLLLVLISDSVYDARSRTLFLLIGKYLDITPMQIWQFERKVTEALEIEEDQKEEIWNESDIMEHRRKKALKKKYMYVGLATVGGGLVLGLSGGLLAPVIGAGIAAGFTTIGITGTGTFLAGVGGAAMVTSASTAIGMKVGSTGMLRRVGHVKTFEFRPLHNNKRLNLIVTVSGWMLGKEDDVRLPFSTVDPVMGDLYSVLWEPEMLQSMGQTINILATEVLTQSIQQALGATILTGLMASIQLPMALSKLGYLLDNPWNVSLDRAWASGLILADTLIARNLGVRPVVLVGFSLGARVIISCLIELARRKAFGLVQDVYIFGCPTVVKRDQMQVIRSMISGRFVNGYSRKDWVLGYLFRATSGGLGRVAGLAPIENVPDLENLDCTSYVEGHMGYRKAIPKLLSMLGWEVFSEEFTEIEDPDPDSYRERQKQLIEELDAARFQMEAQQKGIAAQTQKKTFFGKLFKPKKREWWEMAHRDSMSDSNSVSDAASTSSNPTLFNIDDYQEEIQKMERGEATEVPLFDPTGGKAYGDDDAFGDDRAARRVQATTTHNNSSDSSLTLRNPLATDNQIVPEDTVYSSTPEEPHMTFDDDGLPHAVDRTAASHDIQSPSPGSPDVPSPSTHLASKLSALQLGSELTDVDASKGSVHLHSNDDGDGDLGYRAEEPMSLRIPQVAEPHDAAQKSSNPIDSDEELSEHDEFQEQPAMTFDDDDDNYE